MTRTALVTGGNRGIGLEVCRQLGRAGLRIILGARNPSLGRGAADELRAEGLEVRVQHLDVASDVSVGAAETVLGEMGIAIDVLINNAGFYPPEPLLEMDAAGLRESLEVNLLGAFRAVRAFLPGMIERGYGRVVQVSSGYGSFAQGLEGPGAYAVGKAALNALTVKLASEVPTDADVKVNAACPGWVRTRMGGADAERSVEEGAAGIVRLATLQADGPTGGFFRDGEPIEW